MTKEKEYTRYVKDPIMEPYFISMDDNCLTVNISVTPDARYSDSTKEYTKVVGHYSNMASALKSIAQNKVNSQSYDSIKEYMATYTSLVENFSKTFSI
jgi:uncharacterized protein YutD